MTTGRPSYRISPFLAAFLGRSAALTADEEQALARRRDDPAATPAERRAARDTLYSRNIRLAVLLAVRKAPGCQAADREDAVSSALIGLGQAVDRFDPDRGIRFSTHAAFWINKEIIRGFHHRRPLVAVPVGVQAAIYAEDHGRRLGRWSHRSAATKAAGRAALRAVAGGTDDSGAGIGINFVPADAILRSSAAFDESALAACRAAMAAVLTGREAAVLAALYGLDGGEPRTLREVAEELGCCHWTVGLTRRRALAKLRAALGVPADPPMGGHTRTRTIKADGAVRTGRPARRANTNGGAV